MTEQKKKDEVLQPDVGVDLDSEDLAIVATGEDTTKHDHFELSQVTEGDSMDDIYDRFMKLIYLIDVSASMMMRMAPENLVQMYVWTDAAVEMAKKILLKEGKKQYNLMEDWEDDEDDGPPTPEEMVEAVFDISLSDTEAIKGHVSDSLDRGETMFEVLNLKRNYNLGREGLLTRLEAVKKAAKEFVAKRFEKYAGANVAVMKFDHAPTLLTQNGTMEEVQAAIDSLQTEGGTSIDTALDRAINECKRRPSQVDANHIVLITDGEDYCGDAVLGMVPRMKDIGIVLDFIYIKASGSREDDNTIQAIREACEATGGEYMVVSKVSDFRQKFFQASERKCLPPARD